MTKVINFNINRVTKKTPVIGFYVKELEAIYNVLLKQYERNPNSFSEEAEAAIGILAIRIKNHLNPKTSNIYKSFEKALWEKLFSNQK